MSKKTLNKANLIALGSERLADLLMEVSTGSADIKRRLRLELSHNLGSADLAHEVRKRLISLRKSKSFISWRKRKALMTDLNTQITMIVDKIAPDDPTAAFELLWQFVELAPSLYERTDDRRGDISDVFHTAVQHFGVVSPRAKISTEALAERIFVAICDNAYGEWDGIIGQCSTALSHEGLAHLKTLIETSTEEVADQGKPAHSAIQFIRNLRDGQDHRANRKKRFNQKYLQEIARIMGDISAYIAQFTKEDLERKSVAAEIAMMMLSENKPNDAFTALERAEASFERLGQEDWDSAYIATLMALGRNKDAQAHRWHCFQDRLSIEHLRAFLKSLPDFDDIEAEDQAKAYVLEYPDLSAALRFFLDWKDPATASQLILSRSTEIDGEDDTLINEAADTLREKHPLASVVLLRSMIDLTLLHSRSSLYSHAARHLKECEMIDCEIESYAAFHNRADYFEALRAEHHYKTSFWAQFNALTF